MPPMTRSSTKPAAKKPPAKEPPAKEPTKKKPTKKKPTKKKLPANKSPPAPQPAPPLPPQIARPPFKTPAFHHFLDKFRKDNPQMKFVEAGKAGNTAWENMTDEQKADYRQIAADERLGFATHLLSTDWETNKQAFDQYINELKQKCYRNKFYWSDDSDDEACFL